MANRLLQRENSRLRHKRLQEAKKINTHTESEWINMVSFFESTCAICYNKKPITKDHIQPIYLGGSDGIENLQPLCFSCNSKKGNDCFDYRFLLSQFLKKRLPSNYKQTITYAQTFY